MIINLHSILVGLKSISLAAFAASTLVFKFSFTEFFNYIAAGAR